MAKEDMKAALTGSPLKVEPIAGVPVEIKRRYSVALPYTAGEGTIRPRFEHEVSVTVNPNDPLAMLKAGELMQAQAIAAFNKFYGIESTTLPYSVQAIEE